MKHNKVLQKYYHIYGKWIAPCFDDDDDDEFKMRDNKTCMRN